MAINVLVVDDSSVMRLLVSDILQQNSNINVVGTAANGKEALDKTLELNPDVVVMDMIMGQYDGLYGVKQIMRKKPTPILLLSSLGNTDLNPIIQALQEGAFDYVNKPSKNNTRIRDIEQKLIRKVVIASRTDISKLGKSEVKPITHDHTFSDNLPYEVVVIGSSTGGPSALEAVITKLPGNLVTPVLIAQHMPENFVPSFVKRLDKMTPLNVVMGKKDMVVEKGSIYISPGSRNMIVRKNEVNEVVIDFTTKRFKEFNFPSIDGLMESVASTYGRKTIGIVLTGMGRDGTEGIKRIKEMGGFTVAQDEATSVVFGMPKEAIKSGKVDRVVPIHEVGNFVVSCLS
ncbi:MAG: chemotaxis-specific protein-glutamate methyltransferase CheB [Cyclobacteriaceae bacterium]|nr:chemotaxis-specific protein-glutamate methyltransferase CheB [Cyclobacteriaceae bacterium]